MRANTFLGPLEGVGPELVTFVGPPLLIAHEMDAARITFTSSLAI